MKSTQILNSFINCIILFQETWMSLKVRPRSCTRRVATSNPSLRSGHVCPPNCKSLLRGRGASSSLCSTMIRFAGRNKKSGSPARALVNPNAFLPRRSAGILFMDPSYTCIYASSLFPRRASWMSMKTAFMSLFLRVILASPIVEIFLKPLRPQAQKIRSTFLYKWIK